MQPGSYQRPLCIHHVQPQSFTPRLLRTHPLRSPQSRHFPKTICYPQVSSARTPLTATSIIIIVIAPYSVNVGRRLLLSSLNLLPGTYAEYRLLCSPSSFHQGFRHKSFVTVYLALVILSLLPPRRFSRSVSQRGLSHIDRSRSSYVHVCSWQQQEASLRTRVSMISTPFPCLCKRFRRGILPLTVTYIQTPTAGETSTLRHM